MALFSALQFSNLQKNPQRLQKFVEKFNAKEDFTLVDGKKIKLPDHSLLVAFAPKDDPKIALAVYIENGGYGSAIAAPITSLLIEKYLNGSVQRKTLEKRMLDLSLQKVYDQLIPKKDSIAQN